MLPHLLQKLNLLFVWVTWEPCQKNPDKLLLLPQLCWAELRRDENVGQEEDFFKIFEGFLQEISAGDRD